MGSRNINFKPLIDTRTGIFCHLLEIGDTKIIIDCGIGKDYDYSIYDDYKDMIEHADCILITSFEISHIGGLGLFKNTQVYCSIPTAILGRIILDENAYKYGDRVLNDFNTKQIKYSQPFKINEIEISAYNTGNLIGNSSYKLTWNNQMIGISYNLNHRREIYLDGFDSSIFENANIFITNSAYVKTPKFTIKSRNESLINFVNNCLESNCESKIIISVSYSRILELFTIFKNQPILVLSSYMSTFIDRSKSMIEWASSKTDSLSDFSNIFLGTVSDIEKYRIVVVDDDLEYGYLGSAIETCNNKNTHLILINQGRELKYENLNVYDYIFKKVNIAPVTKSIDKVRLETAVDSDTEEDHHWTNLGNTILVDENTNGIPFFQLTKKKRQRNLYGETINFDFTVKVNEPVVDEKIEDYFEIQETRSFVKCGIEPNFLTARFDLPGISDFISCKTILQSLMPAKIVVANDFSDCAAYFSSNFLIGKYKIDTVVADQPICLKSLNIMNKLAITENIMQLNFKKILKKRVSKFIAQRSGNFIEMIGDYESFVLGHIDMIMLKKAFSEAGYHIDSTDTEIIINSSVKLSFDGSKLILDSTEINLTPSIINILLLYNIKLFNLFLNSYCKDCTVFYSLFNIMYKLISNYVPIIRL